ncbi:TonB-dependent Receptor Plug Domain [Arachidicoccus rhizosphaerae]|uniref:TonB-dependent Receptor Plug Domain n=1 Tax=Arachidicoccus rhizosphaerae TaxID=551991 RepID=A0A1H4BU47_9BACT|nr:TonB-dependent receptor [Arachidicoccus rhizosphaerae]SEA51686.1 TonB-dependent Receptor Plug Domain [Arachidicoccus rhizosphaerae]
MLQRLVFMILAILISACLCRAQVKLAAQTTGGWVKVSGTVKDLYSGELLTGASVRVTEAKNAAKEGAVTNNYGFFSLVLRGNEKQDSLRLLIAHVGYQDTAICVLFHRDTVLDVVLRLQTTEQQALDNGAVRVYAQSDRKIRPAQMGVSQIDLKEAEKLPVIFGEKDVLKTLSLLPGVKQSADGNAGFYVRGSSAGQNLILLDEAPIYNASHLFGFFSTFNSDAIKDVTLIKGSQDARYGGRLASVLDVHMKEGNNQSYHAAGGIGLISSRLSLEGPIQKGRSSFLVTGRRTYADLFLHLSKNKDVKDNSLYFYDLNAKANLALSLKSHLYFSGYLGSDKLGLKDQFMIDWGNKVATLRLNSILGEGLFSNTSLIVSDYRFNILLKSGNNTFHLNSLIRDLDLKQDFNWNSPIGSFHAGIASMYHQFDPTHFSGGNDSTDYSQYKSYQYSLENAAYLNYSGKLNKSLEISAGMRFSTYSILGPGTYYNYTAASADPVDSVTLSKGQFGKTYFNPEPRVSLAFSMNEVSSLKASYSRNTQHLHLLSNSVSTNPTDQWIGDSYNIKPETADQLSLGYYHDFAQYRLEAETYYKWMGGQVDYRNGADLTTTEDVESQLLYGVGRAYGLELYLKKNRGKLTGWISYTLSRTEKKIAGINGGNWYKAHQDRTHDLSVVALYPISARWDVAGDFMIATGNAVTFPDAKYQINEQTFFYYAKRNDYRMPCYHRMDINFTLKCKPRKHYQSSWSFGLYNVYGRENAYIIQFEQDKSNPDRTIAKQTALFRWVPSVTYNFKF